MLATIPESLPESYPLPLVSDVLGFAAFAGDGNEYGDGMTCTDTDDLGSVLEDSLFGLEDLLSFSVGFVEEGAAVLVDLDLADFSDENSEERVPFTFFGDIRNGDLECCLSFFSSCLCLSLLDLSQRNFSIFSGLESREEIRKLFVCRLEVFDRSFSSFIFDI